MKLPKQIGFNRFLKKAVNLPDPNFKPKKSHLQRKRDFKRAKIECYKNELFKYGFITLVYLIASYEEEENYEECSLILAAIVETNTEIAGDLPTIFNEDAAIYFKRAFEKLGLSGERTILTIPFYAEDVKAEINKIKL